MGWDLDIYGLPADNRFQQLMDVEPDVGDCIQFIKRHWDGSILHGPPLSPGDTLILDEVRRLRTQSAVIPTCTLDRSWDLMHFLLSKARREEQFIWSELPDLPPEHIGTIAVRGERNWHQCATAVQGFPIRFTSVDTVKLVAEWLNGQQLSDIVNAIEPTFEKVGVYKYGESPDNADDFKEWLAVDLQIHSAYYDRMRCFYSQIANDSQCAIFVVD